MQRLFSIFPNGRPGFALLLLRLAAAASLIAHGSALWPITGSLYVCVILSCFLIVGFGVPFWAMAAVLVGAYAFEEVDCKMSIEAIFILTVIACCGLLGGGAYSVDAWLFGRRRVIVGERLR